MNQTLRWLCAIGLFVSFLGCGGKKYTGDERFPLTGKVSFNGEPIDLGTISFLPQGGDKQRVSGGVIENGEFSFPEEKGANAGTYRVEIRWAKKTGTQHWDSELQMKIDDREEGLPPKFHTKSELTVEVAPDKESYDFELKD